LRLRVKIEKKLKAEERSFLSFNLFSVLQLQLQLPSSLLVPVFVAGAVFVTG
jgi:hypothetical protein